MFAAHLVASIVGDFVFDWSLHRFMPEETSGGEFPLWSHFSAPAFVPLRILVAILGTIVGGRITLLQLPFGILTLTYAIVLVALVMGMYRLWNK